MGIQKSTARVRTLCGALSEFPLLKLIPSRDLFKQFIIIKKKGPL